MTISIQMAPSGRSSPTSSLWRRPPEKIRCSEISLRTSSGKRGLFSSFIPMTTKESPLERELCSFKSLVLLDLLWRAKLQQIRPSSAKTLHGRLRRRRAESIHARLIPTAYLPYPRYELRGEPPRRWMKSYLHTIACASGRTSTRYRGGR